MKNISIRVNDCLAKWITSCAQKNRITVSEFVRDLLYEKMHNGQLEVNKFKISKTRKYTPPQSYRTEIGFIIYTAKLLEKFVLTASKQGESLRKTSFEETENLLEQLNFNNKGQRFCVSIEKTLFMLLSNESTKLQLKVIPLIRKLIEDTFIHNNSTTELQLSDLQKIAIKHQITSCKLLEKLVNQTINDAEQIIEESQSSADNFVLKMYQVK